MLSPSRSRDKLFYGWVVVLTFFIVGTAIWGTRFSFGIFFKSIEGEFGLTRTATSAIFSVYMFLGCISALLGSWTLDRYGPRITIFFMGLLTVFGLLLTGLTNSIWQLFITYSVLFAAGSGAIFVVTMATVSRWFDKKRGFALGIAGSGGGLGAVVMAPFATYLISNFGWHIAFIVIGLIIGIVVVPLSRLLRRDPYEIGALPDGAKADSGDKYLKKPKSEEDHFQPTYFSLLQAFRTRNFWLFMFGWLLFAFCLFLVMTHLVPHATDMGISAGEAATVISMIGGASIAGRVLIGAISDRTGRKLTASVCTLLQAGAMVWLIWSHELWMLYLYALVYGFTYGGFSPAMTALAVDTFGLGRIGVIFSVLEIGFGLGAAIGPAVGGLIFDVSSSYSVAFLIGAVAMTVVTLLIVLIRRQTAETF